MAERTEPCKFMVKNSVSKEQLGQIEVQDGVEVRKIKKVVQKLDANGEPIFEIKEVKVKKGCGCKGKNREEKIIKKRIPVTEEQWVTEEVPKMVKKEIDPNKVDELIVCKLYGKVKKSYCQKCSTYKERRDRRTR